MKRLLAAFFAAALALAAFGVNAQSLSASPSSLYSGQPVGATWSGIAAPVATDWIGLYAAGAADNAFVTYVYTGGGASGSTSIGVPANAAAGAYELRLFANDGYTRLATSGAVTVQTPPPATLSASPASVYSSQSVTATWGSIFQPSATDWVGLYAVGAADNAFVTYVYTGGGASGSAGITVPANAAAGAYELRLFSNNGYSKLATSGAVTVQTPPPATLSASPSSVYSGQPVTATWGSIFQPSATDWVGLYVVGAADNAFVTFVFTGGGASGSAGITVPANAAAGTYQLRLFSNNGYSKLATSGNFTVQTPPPATLSVSPSGVQPGGSVTATWASIFAPSGTDWIGFFAPGAADNVFVSWRYTTGTAAGNVPFSIGAGVAPGTYQLRLFSNNGYTKLATSANFAVGSAQLSFIHVDHLNTPRLIADESGTTVWKWDQQEPFGNDVPNQDPGNTGSTFDFPLRFPGQYADKETGLAYNYFRDYDPAVGGYKQSDPIGLRGGVNTYLYVNGNPVSSYDPSGLRCVGGVGCWTTPQEAALANSGNFMGYYQLACTGGDEYACFAQHIAANDNFWGYLATKRLTNALEKRASDSKQCIDEEAMLNRIRTGLASRYANYLPSSQDKASWPTAKGVAQYHWDEFARFRLPSETFGGTPFGRTPILPSLWCPNCR